MTTTCELRVPPPSVISREELQLLLAVKLFEEKRISLHKAAELAGYTYREFIEELSNRGIPCMRLEWDETCVQEFMERGDLGAEERLNTALQAFQEGEASSGLAAQIAGMTKSEFIHELGKRRIPIWNYPAEDIEREMRQWPK